MIGASESKKEVCGAPPLEADQGKGGGDTRRAEVEQAVEDAGGSFVFAGAEENSHPQRWFALVDVKDVADPDAMWTPSAQTGRQEVHVGGRPVCRIT